MHGMFLCDDGRNTVAPMELVGSTDTSWETNRIESGFFKRLKMCMGSFVRLGSSCKRRY